jgi:hypothetical protein
MRTQTPSHAPAARTDTKAPTTGEGIGAPRTVRLGLESTGHSRLALALVVGAALLLAEAWFDFWPRWARFSLVTGAVVLGRVLVERLLATQLSVDAQFLRVEQPSRSTSLVIPWSAIAFVEVRDGDRLLICRHSGETTIVGPFVKFYPSALRDNLAPAAELAEAAIERDAERTLTA